VSFHLNLAEGTGESESLLLMEGHF